MTAARRFLPTDPKDFLRSIVPLVLLAVAAFEAEARLVMLALLVLGTAIATSRNAPVRWAWAGPIPVAVLLVLGQVSILGWISSACPDPTRGLVDGALLRVAAVLGTTFALALILRADRASLLVRWPRRAFRPWIPIGFSGAFVVSLVVLHWGRYGTLAGAFTTAEIHPAGLGLALVYGLAFGLTQEVAYRGALLAWSSRVIGIGAAIVGQAIIVGLAISSRMGTWSVWFLEPAWISAIALALLAGVIAVRTRSLAITLAVQTGIGVAWYLVAACGW